MNDRSLSCFAAAARCGSFSQAAWDLFVTQQSISYTIRRLEEELGYPLFIRLAQRVELTGAGEAFLRWYERFDRALSQWAEESAVSVINGIISDHQIQAFLTLARDKDQTVRMAF